MNKSEEWLDIDGYVGLYQVSNLGRVRSLDRVVKYISYGKSVSYFKKGRVLRPIAIGEYEGIQLSVDGVKEKEYIHRLVLKTFSPSDIWDETVNHIDGDKSNNKLNNLEWATQKENNLHSRRVLKNGVFREVVRIDPKDTTKIKIYSTIREAQKDLGLKKQDSNISKYCKMANHRTYKGYMWRYREEYENENI